MHLNCCISVKSLVSWLMTRWNTVLDICLWIQSNLSITLQLVFLKCITNSSSQQSKQFGNQCSFVHANSGLAYQLACVSR